MATKKLSELSALAVLADADTFLVNDASEAADADKSKYVSGTVLKTYTSGALTAAMALIDGLGFSPQFRLSLTSGNPINMADEEETGTIYYTPYTGNAIQLYNGSAWEVFTLPELSLSLTLISGKIYDVFVDYNSGTPQLALSSAWSNGTTRTDALAYQNGRLVKSGTPAHLYVGTIMAHDTNLVKDTYLYRYVYNYYNKIRKYSMITGITNESPSQSIYFIYGIQETAIASVCVDFTNNTTNVGFVGIQFAAFVGGSGTSYALKFNWPIDDVNVIVTSSKTVASKVLGAGSFYVAPHGDNDAGMTYSDGTLGVDLWM